ncbi:MAG: VWA domain-containing protein [Leptospiraceae bacterium]
MSISAQYRIRSNPFRQRRQPTNPGNDHRRALHRGLKAGLIWFALILTISPQILLARDFQVSILPFRVSGQVPEAYFSAASLPTELQQATAFLFDLHKNYPLDDLERLNRSLPQNVRATGAIPGTDYCAYTRGTHLLKGEASFSGTSRIRITLQLHSCNTGRTIDTGVSSGPLNDLQTLLVQAIRSSARSFSDKQFISWSTSSDEWILVVDQSGSMSGTKKELVRALRSRAYEFQGKLSLGLLLISENGNRLIQPGTNLKEVISILEATATGGEVTLTQVARGLQELKNLPPENRRIVVLTDAAGGSTAAFESALRRLSSTGSSPALLNSPGLPVSTRLLFARLNRSLKLDSPEMTYGMRAGFVEGFSLFFIQKGDRFYVSRKDESAALRSGRLSMDSLEPVATVNLRDDRLNLSSVIQSYAKQKNIRLIGTGDLVSSLEYDLGSLMSGTSEARYKFLVKNHGSAFWIHCQSPSVAKQLERARQNRQSIYLGLQLRQGSLGPENNPSAIFIRSAAEVPSLFIQRYSNLQSEKTLKKQDIWFFLVEVVDSR